MNNQMLPFFPVVDNAMTTFWDCNPHEFQREAIARLLMMTCDPYHPTALLLVQSTGGGKSMVPMTVGCVTCGVTLVLENTQSLAADQVSKFKTPNTIHGPIKAFELDRYKNENDINQLCRFLLNLKYDTNASIFIYSSPEKLLKPKWMETICKLLD